MNTATGKLPATKTSLTYNLEKFLLHKLRGHVTIKFEKRLPEYYATFSELIQ